MHRPILDSRRKVISAIIHAYPGGREGAAALLGLELKKFDNQAYESTGHRPLSDDQLHALEQVTNTSHLPDYMSGLYGGVFVKQADAEQLDNLDLYTRGMATAIKRGAVDSLIAKALADGVIDEAELAEIVHAHRQHIAARHSEVDAVITLHRRPQK
ncbi:YmfL family putative regulatory protein [Pseudomonas sp. M30-35]|uniref:YmfL family putative regulatory protein n=1 Tax=Pseudomonas sp. M30-35 TaxID=1981174 RepID=UPI000B3BFF6D|nr:YmfL family putative regulatory protein [Pseudomonas sp. M30-35]ARU88270.1 hypothetical protein B9K09_09985 [Pseudomonas sp. M30-35]